MSSKLRGVCTEEPTAGFMDRAALWLCNIVTQWPNQLCIEPASDGLVPHCAVYAASQLNVSDS